MDTYRHSARVAVAAVSLAAGCVASTAWAANCVGFTDVDASVSYCKNVEWLKNRKVTLGCTGSAYCPAQPVNRAQMALFMNRLGTALTTQRLVADQAPGAIVLPSGAPVRVCETTTVLASGYPRIAALRGAISGLGNANASAWRATLMVSADNGTSWTNLDAATIHATAPASVWAYASPIAVRAIDATASLRVAIGVRRDDIVTGTTGNLADSRCQLVVEIDNANGTVSPYDVAAEGETL